MAPLPDLATTADFVDPRCSNARQDDDETDVDCGGSRCLPCDGGRHCKSGNDCLSTICRMEECAAAVHFGSAAGYQAGQPDDLASRMVVGDFNGDSTTDILRIGGNSTGISFFLLNNGGGSFSLGMQYLLGREPIHAAAADFDNDGRPDFAVALRQQILLGLGDGHAHLQSLLTTNVVADPNGLDVADFDGDGDVDIAVSDYYQKAIAILYGRGDGTLANKRDVSTVGEGPMNCVVGDLDGDGHADVVTTSLTRMDISLYRGRGSKMESTSMPMTYANVRPLHAIADLNGDGFLDLVVPDQDQDKKTFVSLYWNDGKGAFGPATRLAVANEMYPPLVRVADINGDLAPDLVLMRYRSGETQIRLGLGDGRFATPFIIDLSGIVIYQNYFVIADFNRDSRPDLAVTGHGWVYILMNESH